MMNQQPSRDGNAGFPLVAVAIDKDKGSQCALKWAIDNVVAKAQTLTLVHVNTKSTSTGNNEGEHCYRAATDPPMKDLFLPFRCYCTRKNVHCQDVVIEETDVAKAVVEFVSQSAVEKLVVGAPSRGGFVRKFKSTDISSSISKGAPDFCTVYVISKGKVSSMRKALRAAPAISPLRAQIQNQASRIMSDAASNHGSLFTPIAFEQSPETRMVSHETIKSPFCRSGQGCSNAKSYADLSFTDSDISFVSSGRPSVDHMLPPRLSNVSDSLDRSFESTRTPSRCSMDSYSIGNDYNSFSSGTSWSSQNMEYSIEEEMRRLKLELKQTMDMYSAACKEALTAKQKAVEFDRWKMEEEQRLGEARMAEGAALAMVERERAKCRAAIEAAEASQRIAELEAQKRINAEMRALKGAEERKKMNRLCSYDTRCRTYTIEEIEKATNFFTDSLKIGEGGYGPVYKCHLDHTPVAIKVLRPDAAQGRSQFHQEVEVLSCIRHPHMVLLLGACPEYGCLVYEYMANGSLDDRLFRRGGTPVIPWQHRFRIAAEIATGLLFLHQTKPEPLVHRDLKPSNILLDRNYISKISDVGLARLVPPSMADSVTQYRMTSAAGTFCYIDPEYQQTGMLGVKSDIYSLGVMLLQIITAKPPMGLTHHVSRAIKKGTFAEMLDPAVTDWPVEEVRKFAEISLQCAELRRKDRPDLSTVVLPELDRLRDLGEENMQLCVLRSTHSSPIHSQVSMEDGLSDPLMQSSSGYDSSRTSSAASNGRKSNVD